MNLDSIKEYDMPFLPFLVSHVTIHICITNWELCSKAFHLVGFELVPSMKGKLKTFHLLLQSYATICMHCANVRPIVASLNNRSQQNRCSYIKLQWIYTYSQFLKWKKNSKWMDDYLTRKKKHLRYAWA